MKPLLRFFGNAIARYLSQPVPTYHPLATTSFADLDANLRAGDVLLVEGDTRISGAIKYLTQSTWSHAALCLGRGPFAGQCAGENALIEVDLMEGVRIVPAARYADFHTRICRPVGLAPGDVANVVALALARLGHRYDLKNVLDLCPHAGLRPILVPDHFIHNLIFISATPLRVVSEIRAA